MTNELVYLDLEGSVQKQTAAKLCDRIYSENQQG